MGYKIATTHPELSGADGRQLHFLHGAAMQWLNPKAWVASLSGLSAFEATPDNGLFIFVGLHLVIVFFSVSLWAYAGARVSGLMRDPGILQWCNRILGGMLVALAAYLLYWHTQLS